MHTRIRNVYSFTNNEKNSSLSRPVIYFVNKPLSSKKAIYTFEYLQVNTETNLSGINVITLFVLLPLFTLAIHEVKTFWRFSLSCHQKWEYYFKNQVTLCPRTSGLIICLSSLPCFHSYKSRRIEKYGRCAFCSATQSLIKNYGYFLSSQEKRCVRFSRLDGIYFLLMPDARTRVNFRGRVDLNGLDLIITRLLNWKWHPYPPIREWVSPG